MLCDTILMICLLGVVPLIIILVFVVIGRIKGDTKTTPQINEQNDICVNILDKELREAFLNEYINSDNCVWVKVVSLPKSFKIGNVYFDKCIKDSRLYQTFLSHVVIDRKVYDNGNVSIYQEWDSRIKITNKDLMNYILNNLDKVEGVGQWLILVISR